MATTIGLTISALEQIDVLDEFEGKMEVNDEEYRVTVEYSLDKVTVKKVEKRYYNEFREVSKIDSSVNMMLFTGTFLQYLRDRKRVFNIEEHYRKLSEEDYDNQKFQDKITNWFGSMAGY